MNIIGNDDENEENLLKNYPKLKERKYCFEEFKINEKNNIECIYNIKDLHKENKIINYIKQDYKDTYLYKNEKEEVKKYFEIYLNNKKIDLEYKFKEIKKYKILIKFKRPLNNMSYMFCGCSSLTSLNLSNFKINNVNNMSGMFLKSSSLTSLNYLILLLIMIII